MKVYCLGDKKIYEVFDDVVDGNYILKEPVPEGDRVSELSVLTEEELWDIYQNKELEQWILKYKK